MIITITINPTLEYICKVDNISYNTCQNAKEFRIQAFGAGINVSRILGIFNQPNAALSFLGGVNGDRFRRIIEEEGIYTNFIPAEAETSLNIEFIETESGRDFKLKVNGAKILDNELLELRKRLERLGNKTDFVYMGGNIPDNIHDDVYLHLIEIVSSKGIKCILDASNEALIHGVNGKPYLISPNVKELAELVERGNLTNLQQIKLAASMVVGAGVKNVVVTLGKDGAMWVNAEKIIYTNSPAQFDKKVYGAGDALVGGLLYGIRAGFSEEDSLKYGVASGTALVMSYPDFPYRMQIEQMYQKVEIISIEENKYI